MAAPTYDLGTQLIDPNTWNETRIEVNFITKDVSYSQGSEETRIGADIETDDFCILNYLFDQTQNFAENNKEYVLRCYSYIGLNQKTNLTRYGLKDSNGVYRIWIRGVNVAYRYSITLIDPTYGVKGTDYEDYTWDGTTFTVAGAFDSTSVVAFHTQLEATSGRDSSLIFRLRNLHLFLKSDGFLVQGGDTDNPFTFSLLQAGLLTSVILDSSRLSQLAVGNTIRTNESIQLDSDVVASVDGASIYFSNWDKAATSLSQSALILLLADLFFHVRTVNQTYRNLSIYADNLTVVWTFRDTAASADKNYYFGTFLNYPEFVYLGNSDYTTVEVNDLKNYVYHGENIESLTIKRREGGPTQTCYFWQSNTTIGSLLIDNTANANLLSFIRFRTADMEDGDVVDLSNVTLLGNHSYLFWTDLPATSTLTFNVGSKPYEESDFNNVNGCTINIIKTVVNFSDFPTGSNVNGIPYESVLQIFNLNDSTLHTFDASAGSLTIPIGSLGDGLGPFQARADGVGFRRTIPLAFTVNVVDTISFDGLIEEYKTAEGEVFLGTEPPAAGLTYAPTPFLFELDPAVTAIYTTRAVIYQQELITSSQAGQALDSEVIRSIVYVLNKAFEEIVLPAPFRIAAAPSAETSPQLRGFTVKRADDADPFAHGLDSTAAGLTYRPEVLPDTAPVISSNNTDEQLGLFGDTQVLQLSSLYDTLASSGTFKTDALQNSPMGGETLPTLLLLIQSLAQGRYIRQSNPSTGEYLGIAYQYDIEGNIIAAFDELNAFGEIATGTEVAERRPRALPAQ